MSDTSSQRFVSARHFPALDGLRGLSILAVVWHHAVQPNGIWGYFGVSLFFAISGFLITTLLLREERATGTIALGNFYMRRTLRIFPLYYAVLSLYVVVTLVMEGDSQPARDFFDNLPYFVTYTSNLFVELEPGVRTIFFFSWSLATEEQFYLVWPNVVRLSRGWRLAVGFMATVLAASLVTDAVVARHPEWESLPLRTLVTLAPIAFGCLAAYAVNTRRGRELLWPWLSPRWAPAALLALAAASALAGLPWGIAHALMTAVVVSSCFTAGAGAALLELSPLRAVGVVSYGMYLMHLLVLNAVHRVLPASINHPVVQFLAASLVVFLVARVSFVTFERYFMRFKDRFRSATGPGVTRHEPAAPLPPLLVPQTVVTSRATPGGTAVLEAVTIEHTVSAAPDVTPHLPKPH